MKKTDRKSNQILASEWNNIARFRHQQIIEKEDLSYHYIIIPSLLSLIEDRFRKDEFTNVLDAGCGTGNLTYELSKRVNTFVTGIDISKESIDIAKEEYGSSERISFYNTSIEDFANNISNNFKYDLIVSNMTLMDVSDLDSVLKSISSMLREDGVLVFSITHPVFWSKYWKYEDAEWFNYSEEIFIEAPFKISLDNSNITTSHIHRPLEMYLSYLKKNNLKVIDMVEPMPKSEIEIKYPMKWKYPRFMLMKCSK